MTLARDIMTPGAECIGTGQSVLEAAEKLTEFGVGALPICGTDDQLMGVITDRDIVIKCLGNHMDPAGTAVGEFAQGDVVTVAADDDIEQVFASMKGHQVRRLPVIDDHRLVGVVALADVARTVSDPQAGDLLAAISTD